MKLRMLLKLILIFCLFRNLGVEICFAKDKVDFNDPVDIFFDEPREQSGFWYNVKNNPKVLFVGIGTGLMLTIVPSYLYHHLSCKKDIKNLRDVFEELKKENVEKSDELNKLKKQLEQLAGEDLSQRLKDIEEQIRSAQAREPADEQSDHRDDIPEREDDQGDNSSEEEEREQQQDRPGNENRQEDLEQPGGGMWQGIKNLFRTKR